MQTIIKTLLAGACATSLLLGSMASHAAEIRERTLRFAFQNVQEHPQGQGAKKFADLLAEKSGGKIKVKLFPGGTLGGDVQTVSALQGGTLDLTVLNSGILAAQAKDFAMLDFPFLFNNVEEAHAVIDGPVGQKLAAQLDSKGLISLGYWDLGFRNITNNKGPINKLEDMKGLKLRVIQSPIYLATFSALGANPVAMAFPEVYTGLEQDTIDGQENPFTVIEGSKLYEVQKYLSVTGHIFNPQSFIIGKKTWDRLNDDEKKIIKDAAQEAQVFQRDVTAQSMEKARGNLEKRVTVNDISPEEKDRFRERVQPVIKAFSEGLDSSLVKMMYDEIAKVRAGQ
ncbi:TRAP transporter substrate-binding protein [Pseudomonas sp. DSP3-2-2]|uniref:TRAP transporter substrate-binding protein n=1 Tax=unclassified Pseudomonas TaxID=196821 RepID=UPI003CF7F9ED